MGEVFFGAGWTELLDKSVFFIKASAGEDSSRRRRIRSCIGELSLSATQAQKLGVKSHTQISPWLEKCCLMVSANVSYQNAAKDVEVLTGIYIDHSTQLAISTPPGICLTHN